jgi:hypothetical protein
MGCPVKKVILFIGVFLCGNLKLPIKGGIQMLPLLFFFTGH